MQFRLLPAFLVFIGSYAPLTFILALQDIKEDSWRLNICLNFKDCVLPVFNHPYLSFFGIFLTTICFFKKVGSDESFYNQIEVERDCRFS